MRDDATPEEVHRTADYLHLLIRLDAVVQRAMACRRAARAARPDALGGSATYVPAVRRALQKIRQGCAEAARALRDRPSPTTTARERAAKVRKRTAIDRK